MSKNKKSKHWVAQYLTLSVIWGASFAFTEAGLEVLSPLGITTFRHGIGALVLVLVLVASKALGDIREVSGVLWRRMALVAILLNVIPGYLFAYAQNHVSTVVASIINSATPILTILMIFIVFRSEKVRLSQVLGVILGLIGGLVALGIEPGDLGENDPVGVLAVVGAITCYGFAIPYVKNYVSHLSDSPTLLAALQVGIASMILVVLFIWEVAVTATFWVGEVDVRNGIQVLILGIGTGIAYIWHFQVIDRAGSAVASTITYPTLLVSLAIGGLVLREAMSFDMLLGATLIVLGSWITQQRPDAWKRLARRA